MANDFDNDLLKAYLGDISNAQRLTDEQERDLARCAQQGDEQARKQLVSNNLKFVITMARQYAGRGLPFEDLISEGNIGMMQAAAKFSPDYGKRFVAYAAPFIRRSMEEAIESQTGLYKVPERERNSAEAKRREPLSFDAPIPAGSQTSFSLLSVVENTDSPRADSHTELRSLSDELTGALRTLNEREQRIVRAIYGIGQDHLTMAEIGEEMGLKRERVRQIRDKALRKLRKASRSAREDMKE